MSSAEVFSWGTLAPVPGEEDTISPLDVGRSSLIRKVYAGFGAAVLVGAKRVEWVPGPQRPANTNIDRHDGIIEKEKDDSWSLPGVEGVALGQNHTLLLRSKGEGDGVDPAGGKTQVLAWGSGRQGQLGLGAGMLESKLPRPILALSPYRIVQVACGAQHSAAVTCSGDLFTWGRGIEGQLGHSSRHLPPEVNDAVTGVQLRPKPVPAFLATKKRARSVAGVSCGHDFTVVVTRTGEVWAFGAGVVGQLGIGRVTREPSPTVVMSACPLTGEPFVEVSAGWAHVLAMTSGGGVFSWGFNALGSLGLGDRRTRFVPEAVPLNGWSDSEGGSENGLAGSSDDKGVTAVAKKINACGSCSGVLTAGGELLTWGCNNDGRLGHSTGRRRKLSGERQRENVLRPRRVERLAKAETTDFALSGGGGVALVPLRVQSIEPASGPLEAGCKVEIHGDAFWDSPDIVVKFTPVARGHKPAAARSAVGTYATASNCSPDGGGGDDDDEHFREYILCTAPPFASPEEVYVEVSVDGASFTTDGTRFKYYKTPEMTQVTPDVCRPPFPRLRLDGKNIIPSDKLLVRFEEQRHDDEEMPPRPSKIEDNFPSVSPANPSPPGPSARIFVVPGRAESEKIEVGIDPETGNPIEETRCFVTCDAPPLHHLGEAKFPFTSSVTVAPNGATFEGGSRPLRFVAHDPHADCCRPTAVPIPVTAVAAAKTEQDKPPARDGTGPQVGALLHITGRNLYSGTGLAVRLRFGSGCENTIPLDAVAFDRVAETITGALPLAVGELVVPGIEGQSAKDPPRPPAREVAVEVSVDNGREYFAVPERLTLYRSPKLSLKGDGLFPAHEGGLAELVTVEPTFRGHGAMVRLVSVAHDSEVTLPLLSVQPPPAEPTISVVDDQSPDNLLAAEGKDAGARPSFASVSKARPPSTDAPPKRPGSAETCKENKSLGQATLASAAVPADGGETAGCESVVGAEGGDDAWEEREVPASAGSFFFVVPPLPTPAARQTQDGAAGHAAKSDDTRHDGAMVQPPPASTPHAEGAVQTQPLGRASSSASTAATPPAQDSAETEEKDDRREGAPDESNSTLKVFVSLNGRDWLPAAGPPLTYFQPPTEPVVEDITDPKRANKSKKK